MNPEWILKGGWVMVPLLIFSVIMLAVIIERAIKLHRAQVISEPIVQALEEGRSLQDVELLIQSNPTVLSRFLAQINQKNYVSKEILEELAHSYFKRIWQELEKRLEILNIIATTSPLLGLLGTVLGMVSIFHGLASGGAGNSLALSQGISEALITTITGLIIAVPALIAYTFFSKKAEKLLLVIEECGKLYIAELKGLINTRASKA